MEQWHLIDLGKADPYMAQTFYEAVTEAVHRDISPNTLILVQPDSPYACIGYHQDLEKEIDIDYITARALVGNFIMDLNYKQMARVLKVPNAKFRDKMASSMEQWVSNLRKELGVAPSPSRIKEVYVKEFSEQLGVEIIKESPTEAEYNIYREETLPRHTGRDWLYMDSPLYKPGRAVKIAHEVKVVEVDHKAGKLLRIRAEVQGEQIIDLRITGDLFVVPKEAVFQLEQRLIGSMLVENELTDKITKFYDQKIAESPGVTVKDYVDAFMKLKSLI